VQQKRNSRYPTAALDEKARAITLDIQQTNPATFPWRPLVSSAILDFFARIAIRPLKQAGHTNVSVTGVLWIFRPIKGAR
jgi:hypothetical protein